MTEEVGAHFREILSHVPTGVTIITSQVEGIPVGVAVGTFFSVSLDPPLIGWCAGRTSTTWPKIRAPSAFSANVLAHDQGKLCQRFASSGLDRFDGVDWEPGPARAPRIEGALAWIDCAIDAVHPAGDHDICIGRVHELRVRREVSPLVFYRRAFAAPRFLQMS